MTRLVSSIFIALATLALAQPVLPKTPVSTRPVLRAQPLDGEKVNSKPTPPAAPLALPKVSPLDVKPTGDDALRLQIFLDEAKFGPGIIDAKPGRFTELAVQSWNEVNGYPIEDWVAANTAARKTVLNPLAVAVVPDLVIDWVNENLPTKVELQAKAKRMSYRSVAEFMAERYHCDVPYLATLNGESKIEKLKPRDSLTVPNVRPFCIEVLTGAGYKNDGVLSKRHAVVDTKINQVRIYEAEPAALVVSEVSSTMPITHVTRPNRGLIASFPITPGEDRFLQFGTWEVRNAVELPHWRYDLKLLETGKRSSESESLDIPPGPNSPVGIFWCGLTKPGVGMHGTPTPETIGRARSHGCIRMANWDAVRLPTLIRPGTTVEIR